jgi:hypothetical protein
MGKNICQQKGMNIERNMLFASLLQLRFQMRMSICVKIPSLEQSTEEMLEI